MTEINPQAKQMADESMIRTLDAQARAIWPQEVELVRRYGFPDDIRILDAGCGTGEGAVRFAELFPKSQVLGVDIIDHHLELARTRHARIGARLTFEHQSIYELPAKDGAYDLTVCRHVTHSILHPERVYRELARVTRKGGRLHVIPEDYGMLHFENGPLNLRDFWHHVPATFGEQTNTDLFIGRHSFGMFAALGLADIRVGYVIVDTLRVPRETFATIFEAWRDGYAESIGETSRYSADEATAHFNQMISNVRDPKAYAVWFVPVVSARVV